MAEIFGGTDDWKTNYKILKTCHDEAYNKIDQGISCEHNNQIDSAVQKYDEGLLLIDKALAVPIDCPSNPDSTWERACKMAEQMRRTRKEILSRLADIQATRNAIAQSCQQSSDVPDAPPSYDEAVASSSTIYPNPTAQPAMPSTQPMPYATPSSSYASIIDSRSQTPSYGLDNASRTPSTTSSGTYSPYPELPKAATSQPQYPEVPKALYPDVPKTPNFPLYYPEVPKTPFQPNPEAAKGSSTSPTPSKPRTISLSELGKALESAKHELSNQSAVEIFTCNNVSVCHVCQDGQIGTSSQTECLKIFLTEDMDNPHYYIQVGNWRYPLIKGVSPCIRTRYDAFLFPDVDSNVEGRAIALIVAEDCVEPLAAILEDILNVEIQYGAHPGTRPPSDLPETISQHIISGGNYISNALIKGAEKVEQCLNYGTPRVIDKISANKEPTELPSKLQKTVKVTKNVSETAAKTTGYIANKVSSATVGLGKFLSPHVYKGGTTLLTKLYGCPEQEASQTVDNVLTVGTGATQGIGAVYNGLEVAGAVLGRSIADSTVQIVKHKYGQPAGEFTEDSFHTVGNVLEVNTNVRSLATKRLIKNTVKQTGKQVMLERSDQSKSPKNSKSAEKEPKPSDKPEKGF
ncbi:hypothetical protein M8J75_000434 [Diaphorina citri]|nr:hypothetical protein M8J75_000434 [Diaphorina citri]